ncbi:MAG: HAD family hydrolase [Pseudomonadota bacterium]
MPTGDLVLFGLDGVLVDMAAPRERAWAEALAAAGLPTVTGLGARLEGATDRSVRASLESAFGHPLPTDFADTVDDRLIAAGTGELVPVQDALGALRRLRAQVGVVSSTSERVTRAALHQVGLWRHFTSALFVADQLDRVPPAPDIYQYAAAQLGVPAARCLVIESTVHGVRGGKAAGMTVFGFAGAARSLADAQGRKLHAAGADLVFDRMRELAPLIGAHAA